jgi:hypothetical protein
MGTKVVLCIGIVIGLVIGSLGTAYYAGGELLEVLDLSVGLLMHYQFMQGVADRCAVEVGVVNQSLLDTDNSSVVYNMGFRFMDEQIANVSNGSNGVYLEEVVDALDSLDELARGDE